MTAYIREWPEPEFVKEVEEAFPDQGIANVEEARVCLLAVNIAAFLSSCSQLHVCITTYHFLKIKPVL